jgi:hypothetical protein
MGRAAMLFLRVNMGGSERLGCTVVGGRGHEPVNTCGGYSLYNGEVGQVMIIFRDDIHNWAYAPWIEGDWVYYTCVECMVPHCRRLERVEEKEVNQMSEEKGMNYYNVECPYCHALPSTDGIVNHWINCPLRASKREGPLGWICPKCGRGNAPWVGTCPCGPIISTTGSNNTGGTGCP